MNRKLIMTGIKITIIALLWALVFALLLTALWAPPFIMLAVIFGALAFAATGILGIELLQDLNKWGNS